MCKLPICIVFIFARTILADFPKIQTNTYNGVPTNWHTNSDTSPFVKIGTNYYLVEDQLKLNWHQAAHYCRTQYAQLASIENALEMQFLNTYLRGKGYNYWFWISGNDLGKEADFYWLGNGEPLTYAKWSPGQPDNHEGKEHCVHLWISGDEYFFNDRDCFVEVPFICQANMPRTISFTIW